MAILKRSGLGIVGIVSIGGMVGFLIPSNWTVKRSIVIQAPQSSIYPLVANFKTGWPQWSHFDIEDKSIQYHYSGPEEGVAATRTWTSKEMGDGTQTITSANTDNGIEFTVTMTQNPIPISGKLIFEPVFSGTRVTWTDTGDFGKNPFKHYLAVMMDTFLGKSFEKSLMKLKERSEASIAR